MSNIRRDALEDGVFLLTFERPDAAKNVLDAATLDELESHLDFVAGAGASAGGLIFASAKTDHFLEGADLEALLEMNREEAKTFVQRGQAVLRKLGALPFPIVAAVRGAALGEGFELCLACDWRLAAREAATQLGLPQVKVGLLPAWGGSTRLPRLLGVPEALDVILAGQVLPAHEALRAGLVDEVVPAEHLLAAARSWLGRGKYERELAHSAPVNALVDAVIAPKERHEVQVKTHGHYPAMEKALEVVLKGSAAWDEADALERERDAFAELLASDVTRELIHLHAAQEHAMAGAAPVDSGAAPTIQRTTVLGGGALAAGLAQWLSAHGLPVILRTPDIAAAASAVGQIAGLYAAGVRSRLYTESAARAGLDRLSPAPAEVPLQRVDLVLDATDEALLAKIETFRRLDALTRPDALLATSSATISLRELAAATAHPGRVVGLHFFDPVHKSRLVEVVAGPQTAPETAQRAVRLVQSLGKVPILVQDRPGLLVARVLGVWLIEACALFWGGAAIKDVDGAMRGYGLPMGPLRLIDEIGADTALHLVATLAAAFPGRCAVPEILPALAATGLLGRKLGHGFYKYRKGIEAAPNKEVAKLRPPGQSKSPTRAEIEERLELILINEAARCLEEGVVATAGELDLALVLGFSFPAFRGGPLRTADRRALPQIAADLTRLAASAGPQFAPCASLAEMAKSGKRFYQD